MKHSYNIFFASIVFVFFLGLSACQTYEDGPLFSLKSKEKRVTNNWQAYLVSRNDLDEINEYSTFILDFKEGGDFYWLSQKVDADSTELSGSWELSSANLQIKLSYMVPTDSVNFKEQLLYMDILRLKDDDMWLDYFTDGDYYSLRLSPR